MTPVLIVYNVDIHDYCCISAHALFGGFKATADWHHIAQNSHSTGFFHLFCGKHLCLLFVWHETLSQAQDFHVVRCCMSHAEIVLWNMLSKTPCYIYSFCLFWLIFSFLKSYNKVWKLFKNDFMYFHIH